MYHTWLKALLTLRKETATGTECTKSTKGIDKDILDAWASGDMEKALQLALVKECQPHIVVESGPSQIRGEYMYMARLQPFMSESYHHMKNGVILLFDLVKEEWQYF